MLLQEVRYAARALHRNPSLTLVVVATFALGIGMNTAVFSVANAVPFPALPHPNADRLVWLANFSHGANRDVYAAHPE